MDYGSLVKDIFASAADVFDWFLKFDHDAEQVVF